MSETTTRTPRYPGCVVQLTGEDGNAFAILGRVHRQLRKHLRDEHGISGAAATAIIDEFDAESTMGDFDHLLATVERWVEVA